MVCILFSVGVTISQVNDNNCKAVQKISIFDLCKFVYSKPLFECHTIVKNLPSPKTTGLMAYYYPGFLIYQIFFEFYILRGFSTRFFVYVKNLEH